MTKEELESYSILQLKKIAREQKIPYYSKLKKQEIIDALKDIFIKDVSDNRLENNSVTTEQINEKLAEESMEKDWKQVNEKLVEERIEKENRREDQRAYRNEMIRTDNEPNEMRRSFKREEEYLPRREYREDSERAYNNPHRPPLMHRNNLQPNERPAYDPRQARSYRTPERRESYPLSYGERAEARLNNYPYKRPERKDDMRKEDFVTEPVAGILEILPDGYGFLRPEKMTPSDDDIYISPSQIRRFRLRNGDAIVGDARKAKDTEKYSALLKIISVNTIEPDAMREKRMDEKNNFDELVPLYPDERIIMGNDNLSARLIDLVAPIGFGQRGLIVAPPKAGKTELLKNIANSILDNNSDIKLMVLLIDERPEEVTDIARSIHGKGSIKIISSTFDMTPENHMRVAELTLERAKRLVELGQDVIILLDSITRLARAYNLTQPSTGKTLSGGLDPGALHKPKRFFGAARNIENGGSLTIIATALVDTGSRMDDMIFEEFKGTGNMELHLERKIADKRIFPALDVQRSGTRKEDLLLEPEELDKMWTIRKSFNQRDPLENLQIFLNGLKKTKTNKEFLATVK